ncbi:MAG: amino acid--tRNA ligase-related protein, partial [Bacteroidota bacterium]
RYLDLRTQRMAENLRMRNAVAQIIRQHLDENDFIEVETPILTAPTPEGARDYLVPSRLSPGDMYAMPQSPQQFKQLLMASGVGRYYQMARCLRDEDLRGDRQPEFTQMDLEMSFVSQEEIMQLNEEMLIKIVETLYPEKTIQEKPFPRLTYKEAMQKYGSDRPDLRKDKEDPNLLAFCWVIDFPFFEKTEESDDPNARGNWTFTHNPFSQPKDEFVNDLMQEKNIGEILTSQYDVVLNGFEIGGGSVRAHKAETLEKVFEILGYSNEEINRDFAHMLHAFKSGTPPHGGIAWGFDRLVMILQNEPNIREVIAFPKNGEGRDLMMKAPIGVRKDKLDELYLVSTAPEPEA